MINVDNYNSLGEVRNYIGKIVHDNEEHLFNLMKDFLSAPMVHALA